MTRDEWWNLDWTRAFEAYNFAGEIFLPDHRDWVDRAYCYGGMCL
jgi:hypothetical protein